MAPGLGYYMTFNTSPGLGYYITFNTSKLTSLKILMIETFVKKAFVALFISEPAMASNTARTVPFMPYVCCCIMCLKLCAFYCSAYGMWNHRANLAANTQVCHGSCL